MSIFIHFKNVQSFRNHSVYFLLRNHTSYNKCWKQLFCLIFCNIFFFLKTKIKKKTYWLWDLNSSLWGKKKIYSLFIFSDILCLFFSLFLCVQELYFYYSSYFRLGYSLCKNRYLNVHTIILMPKMSSLVVQNIPCIYVYNVCINKTEIISKVFPNIKLMIIGGKYMSQFEIYYKFAFCLYKRYIL